MRHFKRLSPRLLNLPEMEEELNYVRKRMYRLRKLQGLGKDVNPDLQVLVDREDVLDIAVRERRLAMSEIPS